MVSSEKNYSLLLYSLTKFFGVKFSIFNYIKTIGG